MSGFFGSISKSDCVSDVYYGTDYHSHLGTKRAGMVIHDSGETFRRAIHSIEDGYFRNKFVKDLKDFKGCSGIGVISDTEAQPLLVNSHLGHFAVATISKIDNMDELETMFRKKRQHFTETSQAGVNATELVAMLISAGETFTDGIENVYRSVKGSCSMLILTTDGIIIARDKLGRHPVVIGKRDGAYAIASESSSFANLGFTIDYFPGPGEIVKVTAEGIEQLRKPGDKMQVCSFMWIYYGYPPSYYENINVEDCRYRCGACLGHDDDIDVDLVAGIPDSGVAHALGYANERKLPYTRPYIKYTPTWPRSFMPQHQELRDLVAKMKLIPIPALIGGKKAVFLDDSIVRGTQLRGNVQDLFRAGAKEIHMRIACPPLTYPCEFLNFSRSRSSNELATRKAIQQLEGTDKVDYKDYSDSSTEKYKAMVKQIRENLGMTSLRFQKLDDLVKAIGLPKEKLCTHCWDGSSYF
ncbi:MAG TPA: amidophosphoribosyltransferase [Bacteroidales bacterium]|nr:amidophosphoribosyltransferase [Bacteroidales bacterium]HPS73946.1 amidophosphoribosyltransferase [Bacteroidales bacterium]